MLTLSQIEQHRQSLEELVRLASDDLARVWPSLDLKDQRRLMRQLQPTFTELTQLYGEASSLLSTDLYDLSLAQSAGSQYRPVLTPPLGHAEARQVAEQAIAQVFRDFDGSPAMLRRKIFDKLDWSVKAAGRRNTSRNARREGVGWARVPQPGAKCGWCITQASRGAVFSERGEVAMYHPHCQCVPVRVVNGKYPEGHDPDDYYEMYDQLVKEAGSTSMTDLQRVAKQQQREAEAEAETAEE